MTSLNLRVYHTVSSLSVEDKAEWITVESENSRWKWPLDHYFRVRNYGFDFDLFDSWARKILSWYALASNSYQVDCRMLPFLCNVSIANCIFGLYWFREADFFSPTSEKASWQGGIVVAFCWLSIRSNETIRNPPHRWLLHPSLIVNAWSTQYSLISSSLRRPNGSFAEQPRRANYRALAIMLVDSSKKQ